MIRLELDSGSEVFNLNEILEDGKGVQALAGASGFGLPTLATQWDEGAGDGATYRGTRVLAREVDLPIYVNGRNRAELKSLVSRLSIALTQECTLRVYDSDEPDQTWHIKVRRTGGGDWTYGSSDTTGENDLMTVLTVKAGDPYWTRDSSISVDINKAAFGPTVYNNPGDAPAYPTWTIHGPGRNLVLTAESGESFTWGGLLLNNQWVEIDTAAGTVVDQDGSNRYADIGPAPRFFALPPGDSTVTIEWDQTSAEFIAAISATRYNRIANPNFETDIYGWTHVSGSQPAARSFLNSGGYALAIYVNGTTTSAKATSTITGLTVGKTYYLKARLTGSDGAGSLYLDGVQMPPTYVGTFADGSTYDIDATFVATATTAALEFRGNKLFYSGTSAKKLDNLYCGETNAYFDGDTPDTASATYAWTGTPRQSASSASDTWDVTLAHLESEVTPRKWAVI